MGARVDRRTKPGRTTPETDKSIIFYSRRPFDDRLSHPPQLTIRVRDGTARVCMTRDGGMAGCFKFGTFRNQISPPPSPPHNHCVFVRLIIR